MTLPVYIVTLQARHGDGIRSLRNLLKRLLRGSALKCLSVRQDHDHQFARHSASSSPAASSSRSLQPRNHEVNMRKIDAMPPRYYRTEGFPDEPLVLEIELVRTEQFDGDGGSVKKPVAYFKRQRSGLVLGSTTWDQIVGITGESDSDRWPGHVVELYKTTCQFGAKTVPCVRVRQVTGAAKKPSPKKVATADEDVPF
jgi:hypothetical protein